MKKIFYTIFFLMSLGTVVTSCSDDSLNPKLEEERDNQKSPIETENDLRMALTGAYSRMSHNTYYGRDYVIFSEVRSGNAFSNGVSGRFLNVTQFLVTPTATYPSETWEQIYKVINSANLAFHADVKSGDKQVINNYKGQALTLRALAHFDLLKLFGQQHVEGAGGADALGVPYITQFAELENKKYARKTVKENRDLIYADLDAAIALLDENVSEKVRVNKQSAYGIKARAALYLASIFPDDYQIAKESAAKALELGGEIVSLAGFEGSYTADGVQVNSVFDLAQSGVDNSGTNSLFYIYNQIPVGYGDVLASQGLKDLFAANDIRGGVKMLNTDSRGSYRNVGKYTKQASNVKVMRFEELVLTYAEAAFRVGGTDAKALELMNELAVKRGEEAYTALTLDVILTERRKELLFEGFGFEDLVRNRKEIPTNPRLAGAIPYGSVKLAFPIPQSEINVSKIQQNKLK